MINGMKYFPIINQKKLNKVMFVQLIKILAQILRLMALMIKNRIFITTIISQKKKYLI
jgi:hypothetical protein